MNNGLPRRLPSCACGLAEPVCTPGSATYNERNAVRDWPPRCLESTSRPADCSPSNERCGVETQTRGAPGTAGNLTSPLNDARSPGWASAAEAVRNRQAGVAPGHRSPLSTTLNDDEARAACVGTARPARVSRTAGHLATFRGIGWGIALSLPLWVLILWPIL